MDPAPEAEGTTLSALLFDFGRPSCLFEGWTMGDEE